MNEANPSGDVLSEGEKGLIQNVDRMLPSQPVMRKLFVGDDGAFHSRLEGLLLSVLKCPRVEEKWDLELKPGVTYASLGSDVFTLHFYQLLVHLAGVRTVLELGTYIGVSTLYFAEAVGELGSVTTVERGQEFFDIARRNFARNGLAGRITPILGSATEALREQAAKGRRFGMILIDAGKEDYAVMFPDALACLAPGGLLVVDDIFMNGDALNEAPGSAKGRGVRQLLADAAQLPDGYDRVVLPIGNGTLLIRRESGPWRPRRRSDSRAGTRTGGHSGGTGP